jgi:hypothetical protein
MTTRRMRGLILLLANALPSSGMAQQLPKLHGASRPESGEISIYVLINRWRRRADGRVEVQTRSGMWRPFPPDGIWASGKLLPALGSRIMDLRLPRTRLDEIRGSSRRRSRLTNGAPSARSRVPPDESFHSPATKF